MAHLHQNDLAERWSLSPRMLEQWRWRGVGLRYLKLGGGVIYRLTDVEAFEAERLHASTVGPIGTAVGED